MLEPYSRASQIFGDWVRNIRVDLGLSQENVADLAQMHVTNFGKIEWGRANPRLLTILRISSVLGVDPASLTEGLSGEHLPESFSVLLASDFIRQRDGQPRQRR